MKKWLLWGIPALILIGLVSWRFATRESGAQTGGPPGGGRGRGGGSANVEVAPATSRLIVQTLESVGNVESPYKVEIAPRTSGRITLLNVREGDPVKPGQVLLKIDPSDLQGAVLQQEANVAEARSRLAQAKITQGSTNVGITSQIRQQQAGLASAQADLNQVQRNYDSQVQAAESQADAASSAVKNAAAALARENASLRNAQIKLDRTTDLYRQGFIAAQDVDDAKTAVDVQQGAVSVASGQLDAAKSQLNVQQQNVSIVKRKGASDVEASKAKVTQARATLAVATANRAQSPAYQENLAALRASVDAAIAQLKQAQSRLADTVVRSTITGTVTDRKADPGALAGPSAPVLEVQYLDWLYVTASLPVEASSKVHEGQVAEITFDSTPGRKFSGRIANVNLAADPQNRQFGIRVRLANANHMLRPGMYARLTLEIQRVNAPVVVPREALKTASDGTTTATVVDADNTAHVRPVTLGASDDQGVQVLSGVNPGEKVVVLSYTPVRDGQKVSLGRPGGQTGRGSGRGRGAAPGGGDSAGGGPRGSGRRGGGTPPNGGGQ